MSSQEPTKDELREMGWLHTIDPEELEGFEDWAKWLEAILSEPCAIYELEGEQHLITIKALVDRYCGLRIMVYPNDHPPPHFHVKSGDVDASFRIDNCDLLKGKVPVNAEKKIRYWHKRSRPVLEKAWNQTRPTDCTVGPIQGLNRAP